MRCQDCAATVIGSVDGFRLATRCQPEAGHPVTDRKANPEVDSEVDPLKNLSEILGVLM